MTSLVVIRAEPGLSATMQRCDDLGFSAIGEALFTIEPVAWAAPSPAAFDGVLLGSANAIRHGGEALAQLTQLPAYCVGQTTSDAAREAGFSVAMIGEGGLQNLLDDLAEKPQGQQLNLLRLAGEKHVPLQPPPGIQIERRIVYRSRNLSMTAALADKLRTGAVVLLHSAEAAQHFANECERLQIERSSIDCALIGPRLAEAVGSGWRSVGWPDTPDDASLVAFAHALCHNPQ